MSGNRRGPRAGFTLAELMLVFAVIGLSTYLVSISFESFVPRERLNTAVRDLTATLREARSLAIARNLEFMVEYDLETDRYRMLTPLSADGTVIRGTLHDEEQRMTTPWTSLPDGVEFDAIYVAGERYDAEYPVVVRFDARGSATDHQVILVQPAYENTYTIEVMALTGLFRFHDGFYAREAPDDSDFQ